MKSDRETWIERLLLLSVTLVFVGFVGSRALISIGTGGILALGIFHFLSIVRKDFKFNGILIIPVIFFVPFVLSYFFSENKAEWLSWLILKLPFLILPLAFFLLPELKPATLRKIFFSYAAIVTLSTFFFLFNYLNSFEQTNNSFLMGGRMPVPFSHIRYSLILVFAVFVLVRLYIEWRSRLLIAAAVYLIIIIHLLSARSGLVALYAALLFSIMFFAVKTKNLKMVAAVVMAALAIAWLSFNFMPSLKNRLAYMRYDYSQWTQGKIDGNSDAMRFASIKAGMEMVRNNFWFGTGTGDMRAETLSVSKRLFPNTERDESRKMPHNEFLWTAAATGITGLFFFLTAWLIPLFVKRNTLDYLAIAFHLIMAVSFMVEYTIEEQVGGTFFILFHMLFLKQISSEK